MNTRKVAAEYRLAQWTQTIQTRISSGQSITDFCASSGISRNTYFYWQRKLRETACEELASIEPEAENCLSPNGWARLEPATSAATEGRLTIEVGGCRIAVTDETDQELLVKVCRMLKVYDTVRG